MEEANNMPAVTKDILARTEKYVVHNYKPLPVSMHSASGVWVLSNDFKQYLDLLACYSALNFGHKHPRLMNVALKQILNGTITFPRCFLNEKLPKLGEELARFCSVGNRFMPKVTGAEAVEGAIKIARKWGYVVKRVKKDKAEIIKASRFFHGRTPGALAETDEIQYIEYFGPFPAGFLRIPFNNTRALEEAINKNTVAFLVEPVQGEGGINFPSDGYLSEIKHICRKNDVLLMLDEVQTGLGRTGYDLAYQHEGEEAKPDVLILAKALGGGIDQISAVLASDEIMDVIKPGDDGSTFGGNPLACAIAIEAINILRDENLSAKSRELGGYFLSQLKDIKSPYIKEIRGRGLMIGVELFPEAGGARHFCEILLNKNILSYYTRENVIRFTPPLIIKKEEINWAMERIQEVFTGPSFSYH